MPGLVTELDTGFVVNDFVSKKFLFALVCIATLFPIICVFFYSAIAVALSVLVAVLVWRVPYGRQLEFNFVDCEIIESLLYWFSVRESQRWNFKEVIGIAACWASGGSASRNGYVLAMLTAGKRIHVCCFTFSASQAVFWSRLAETIRRTLNSDPARETPLPPTRILEQAV